MPPPVAEGNVVALAGLLTAGLSVQRASGPNYDKQHVEKCGPAQVGVSSALLTPPSLSPARIAEELFKLLPPHGPDVVIDCAGFDSTFQVSSWVAVPLSAPPLLAAPPRTQPLSSIDWYHWLPVPAGH